MPNLSLRNRLFLTYLALLLVTVGVIAVAFLIFLNTRAAPPQQTYQRLAAIAQGFPLREIIAQSNATIATPRQRLEAIEQQLTELAEERGVRILLIGSRNGVTIFDTAGTMRVGDVVPIQQEPYTLPASYRRGLGPGVDVVFGRFQDSEDEWLFTGLVAALQTGQGAALLFADPAETQSLQQALADFSSALMLPLCQSALIGLAFALILATLGSRSIARPLQLLARASEDVARGNYQQRVPLVGPPEVRGVGAAFNEMVSQVQASQQAQQDFLANVSHDLKTPLTSIQGYSQAIMDGAAANPVQAASIIYDEAGRLNRMVMQITELARLQSGRLPMNLNPLDLGQITKAVGERVAIVAREKGVRFDVAAAPMPEVVGDGDRLAQVLMNLMSNAIKYTPQGGSVHVETRVVGGGVEVLVRDSGIGIPPDELPRIFERFYQVDKARGPQRGTGLGLAIVREIVQAHGGRINVASMGIGRGATFTLWLPSPQLSTVAARRH